MQRVLKILYIFCIGNSLSVSQILLSSFDVCTQAGIRFLKRNTKFYSCTQTSICFLQRYTKFYSCTQVAISFSKRNTKFKIVPIQPFVLWLRCTKFLKFLQNGHLFLDGKLENLKFHPNCYLFLDPEIQNLKSYSNGDSFFDYKQRK